MEVDREEWSEYSLRPAPATLLCVFWRGGLDRPRVGYVRDFPPEFNVAGLWWKLTGIAKEELDAMPAAQRDQLMPPGMGMLKLLGSLGSTGVSTGMLGSSASSQLGGATVDFNALCAYGLQRPRKG